MRTFSVNNKNFSSIVKYTTRKRRSDKQNALINYLNSQKEKPVQIYLMNGDWNKLDKSEVDQIDLIAFDDFIKGGNAFPDKEYLVIPIYYNDVADKNVITHYYNTSKVSDRKEDDKEVQYVYSYHADKNLQDPNHSMILDINSNGVTSQYVDKVLIH